METQITRTPRLPIYTSISLFCRFLDSFNSNLYNAFLYFPSQDMSNYWGETMRTE